MRFASAFLLLLSCVAPREPAARADTEGVVETLASLLERKYVVPATGAAYATALRSNQARGAYRDLRDPRQLGDRLTADLQAIAPDGHLRVVPDGDDDRPRTPGQGPRRPPPTERAGWVADGIASVQFNAFSGTAENLAAITRFMAEHATARALILDARTHRGGGVDEMNVMLPYLFASETTLVAMEVATASLGGGPSPWLHDAAFRPKEAPLGMTRAEHVVRPHPTEQRLFGAKVYLLISHGTASAGEHFALALKRTRRATLVGERTAGANHFGGFEPIGGGLVVFLPVGRTFDPTTGADWEGVGIEPDLPTSADHAFELALQAAQTP